MTTFWVQKGAMWKISGMLIKFYFLACVDQYKRLVIVYFLHKCPWHAFAKIFFLKSFHRLPMPLRIKSKVLVTVYKTLKTWLLLPSLHSQATQEPQSRLLLQDHPVPCAFNLESSAPQYHYDSFLTSFTCMCKCLPFREVCPPLSSYPFIFLYTTYHSLTNVMLLLYDSLR